MLTINGWTVLAHPLFLDQWEKLIEAVDALKIKKPDEYQKSADAKLLAALSLWVGPALIFDFITTTALAGGLVATAVLLFRKGAGTPALASAGSGCAGSRDSDAPEINGKRVSTPMPYGVAIVAGGLWCVALHYFGS